MITCIGNITLDIIVKPVESLPKPGLCNQVESVKMEVGGCAANAALDLAKLGYGVGLAGGVGGDQFGPVVLGRLSGNGVGIENVRTFAGSETGTSVVCVHSNGERNFLYNPGANLAFSDKDILPDVLSQSDIVFFGGMLLMKSLDGEPCAKILRESKALHKITVLDTVWDFTGRWMSTLKPCIPFIDYFIPSYDEAKELAGENDPSAIADVFLKMGARHVVIKLGKKGCYYKTLGMGGTYYATYSGVKPVDTIGAGDAFCSGFLGALSEGQSVEDCIRFANAVGTFCISKAGASAGIEPKEKVKEFIRKNRIPE